MKTQLARDGFAIAQEALDLSHVDKLRAAMSIHSSRHRAGARNLLQDVPEIRQLTAHDSIQRLVESAIGEGAFPVRALFFDKSPDANWKVP